MYGPQTVEHGLLHGLAWPCRVADRAGAGRRRRACRRAGRGRGRRGDTPVDTGDGTTARPNRPQQPPDKNKSGQNRVSVARSGR